MNSTLFLKFKGCISQPPLLVVSAVSPSLMEPFLLLPSAYLPVLPPKVGRRAVAGCLLVSPTPFKVVSLCWSG